MNEKFQTMSKEEYYNKYGVGIRFLFGSDICNQKDEFEMISLRVFLPKKFFQEYKNIDIFKAYNDLEVIGNIHENKDLLKD